MKKNKMQWLICCLTLLFSTACSSGGEEASMDSPIVQPTPRPLPISLNCGITPHTKATDSGFESKDQIGLYVVNYNGQNPGVLASTGNHVDNMNFTYNGKWTPQTPIYWKDQTTPADFYAYYPYGNPKDVTAYPFQVKADQSILDEFKACDFLWGKATKVMPTEQAVSIQTSHLFSTMIIKVAAGNGFTPESLKAAQVSVTINGCKTDALINLQNGTVEATGSPATIRPLAENDNYKALIVPQNVTADNFITVNIDGRDYQLKKSFTFVSGKRHTFTVTVSKTSNGINVGVNPWEDDMTDHGGTAE